jgi:hypothetical protein
MSNFNLIESCFILPWIGAEWRPHTQMHSRECACTHSVWLMYACAIGNAGFLSFFFSLSLPLLCPPESSFVTFDGTYLLPTNLPIHTRFSLYDQSIYQSINAVTRPTNMFSLPFLLLLIDPNYFEDRQRSIRPPELSLEYSGVH